RFEEVIIIVTSSYISTEFFLQENTQISGSECIRAKSAGSIENYQLGIRINENFDGIAIIEK
ncbi:22263_t:CDS:1, partial [Gigaspora rosea]